MTARGTTLLYALAALIPTVRLCAQQPDDRQTKSSKVLLLESSGLITTLYVPSVEEGALRLQKSMETAYAWYEKQLHLQDVPVTLAVLDKDMWERFRVPSAYANGPYSYLAPTGIVAIPAHTEDPAGGNAGVAGAEGVSFHELGHLFANQLKIRSGNSFVNELIAGIFSVAYIRAERPDLGLLAPINAPFPAGTSPRYTSLADLDYLYMDVGAKNYFWYQHHLERLADFLVKNQSFPAIVEKLQAAFPAGRAKHETLEEIDAHLEGIRPGFKKMAGPLGEPSTITRIKPSACQETSEKSGSSTDVPFVIVQNDTPGPLVVTRPGGTSTVPPNTFLSFRIPVGASIKLPDGACLVARDEPTLAVVEKQ